MTNKETIEKLEKLIAANEYKILLLDNSPRWKEEQQSLRRENVLLRDRINFELVFGRE